MSKPDNGGEPPAHGLKFTIYVDEKPYEVTEKELTGLQIKALAGVQADYQLFLERPGDDLQIDDQLPTKIHSQMKFYALPAADFG